VSKVLLLLIYISRIK